LAPVGYFTLSETGLILEANLNSAAFLAMDRSVLVKQPLARFIHKEDQNIFYLHRQQFLKTGEPQTCELRMNKADGAVFWANFATTCERESGSDPVYCVVMSDITE
jgi:PAS domain S-box-containing protein